MTFSCKKELLLEVTRHSDQNIVELDSIYFLEKNCAAYLVNNY